MEKKMTLEYDEDIERLIEELKLFYGVKTKSAVIKRSLAVARAAKRYSDNHKSVRIVRPGNNADGETFFLGN